MTTIIVREGELNELALLDTEVAFLRRGLRGNARVSRRQLSVQRLAGVWALPSGRTLIVEPRKGSGADLFAWMCAVDPRLFGLASGDSPRGASAGTVVTAAAHAFCYLLAMSIRRSGARRDYAEQRRLQGMMRGRIEWGAFARVALSSRLPCVYWERVLDTPLNRLFAKVIRHLAASGQLSPSSATPWRELLDFFGHVPPAPPPEILDLTRPLARLETPFEPARRLAVVLLECLGLCFSGERAAFTFQIDLARLFEQSVERALLSLSVASRFQHRPEYRGDLAGEGGWSAMDALLQSARGPVVVETKYTTAFSKAHLYQVLAYMKMVDSAVGVLVYPLGAKLETQRFSADRPRRWEVIVEQLDPVRVGQLGEPALREFALEVWRRVEPPL